MVIPLTTLLVLAILLDPLDLQDLEMIIMTEMLMVPHEIEVVMVLRAEVVAVVDILHVIEIPMVVQATQIAVRTVTLVGKQCLDHQIIYLFHTAFVAVLYQPVFEQEANSSNVLSTI